MFPNRLNRRDTPKDIITEQLEKIFAYDDKDSGIKTFLHPKVPMRMVGALLEGRFNPSDYKNVFFRGRVCTSILTVKYTRAFRY